MYIGGCLGRGCVLEKGWCTKECVVYQREGVNIIELNKHSAGYGDIRRYGQLAQQDERLEQHMALHPLRSILLIQNPHGYCQSLTGWDSVDETWAVICLILFGVWSVSH